MTRRTGDAPRRSERDDERTVTVPLDGGGRIAYAEYGRPDGAPVVLFHGTPGSRRFGRLFETAAERVGVRVIAPDRPGYGRSSPRPQRSVRDAGAFVATVLDDAGVETAGLVAFSGGGPYALATAATRPDRVGGVDIVAGAPPPSLREETPPIPRLLSGMAANAPTLLRGLLRGQAWLADRLDPSFVVAQYTTGRDAESVPDPAAATLAADFVEAFARHRQGAVTEFRHAATAWDVPLDDVEADVRLWHGENDTNVPIDGARRLATRLPTARLRAFDDADHLRTLLRCRSDVLESHR